MNSILPGKTTISIFSIFVAILSMALPVGTYGLSDDPPPAPIAADDEVYTHDYIAISGNLAENDLNPGGGTLTYTLLETTDIGILSVQANGLWDFTPMPDTANAYDTLTYQVCSSSGGCSIASIFIYIVFQNNSPEPHDDIIVVEMNEPRFGNAAENDFEPDFYTDPLGSTDAWGVLTGPTHGTVIFNVDGTFEYTPNAGYVGPDAILYQMCDPCGSCANAHIYFNVTGNNDDPVANSSLNNAMIEDGTYTGDASLLASDPDSDPLTFQSLGQPAHGFVTMNANGTFTYQPYPDYSGNDSFMYLVCDIVGQCAVATISFIITDVNDPPSGGNETFFTTEDIPAFTESVATNDEDDGSGLTYSVFLDALHGILTLAADGAFSYTPDENYFGQETIIYTVCDDAMLCDQDTLIIVVTPLNDWPIPESDEAYLWEDSPLYGTLANDVDVDGDVLTYTSTASPIGGTFVVSPNGDYVYTPNLNYWGFEVLTYQVCDPYGACSNSFLSLEIIEVNDGPVIIDETFLVNEDVVLNESVHTNDIEPENEIMTYFNVNYPPNGAFEMFLDGTFTYTPHINWSGTEVISYYGCDPCGVCVPGTLTITVTAVNDMPSVTNGSGATNEDTTLNGTLVPLANDIETAVLTFSIISGAAHGTFTLFPAGSFTYIPNSNYFGPDQITFQACDGNGGCVSATYAIQVNSVNDSPVAIDDNAGTNEDTTLSGSVANDTDLDDVVLSYEVITGAMHGTLVMTTTGSYTYTPEPNFNGVDMITYSVCDNEFACDAGVLVIDVTPVNDAPVVLGESNVTYANSSLSGNVASNDSDPDGDVLTYSIVTNVIHGTITLNASGAYIYMPASNYSGTDQLTYQACDGNGQCITAVLSITITATNSAPAAVNDTFTTNEDGLINGNVSLNDTDSEGGVLTFAVLTSPSHGTLVLNSNGTFTYTPAVNYNGTDFFTYQVCDTGDLCDDAQVNINVISLNDAPSATDDTANTNEDTAVSGSVGTNDTDVDDASLSFTLVVGPLHGSLTLSAAGNFTYTPNLDYFGTEVITYSVCDDENSCDSGTLTIQVILVNDAPTADADNVSVNEDSAINGDVSANDSDMENDPLSYSLITDALHGEFVFNTDGTFTYAPDANFNGSETIVYSVCDLSLCTQATLTIVIVPVNDPPVAIGESHHVLEDTLDIGDLSPNDMDVDGGVLTYSILYDAGHGAFNLMPDGSYEYAPVLDFWGLDSLTYLVCDNSGACDTATIQLIVDFLNDTPIAVDEAIEVEQDGTISGDVSANDIELDDEVLIYMLFDDASNGVFDLEEDGTFTYTPNAGVIGTFTVIYKAIDPCGVYDFGTLTIVVVPLGETNTAPISQNASITICQGSSGQIALNDLVNDIQDIDDMLSFTFSAPASGSYSMDDMHVLTYTATAGNTAPVTINYTVCDNSVAFLCSQSVITINITPTNQPVIGTMNVINVECYGGSDGSIDLGNVMGEGSFTYDWDSGQGTQDITGLVAGDYTVTVTSDAPCSIPASLIVTVEGPSEELSVTATSVSDISDEGNGAVDIVIAGGTAPYEILWSGPGDFSSLNEDISELSEAGTYTADIHDLNGCAVQVQVVVDGINEEAIQFGVDIFPNPFTGNFTMQLKDVNGANVSYRIQDVSGRLVLDKKLGPCPSGKRIEVDMHSQASGLYQLTITADGSTRSFKLINE